MHIISSADIYFRPLALSASQPCMLSLDARRLASSSPPRSQASMKPRDPRKPDDFRCRSKTIISIRSNALSAIVLTIPSLYGTSETQPRLSRPIMEVDLMHQSTLIGLWTFENQQSLVVSFPEQFPLALTMHTR